MLAWSVVPVLVATVLAIAILVWLTRWIQASAARRPSRRGRRRIGGYEFEARSDQAKRRLKGVAGPAERRDEIVEFLDTHEGVEAYMEPKTVVSPKSVVLIDAAGEWAASSSRRTPTCDGSRRNGRCRSSMRP